MRLVTGTLGVALLLHIAAIWLFSRGFLLNRVTLNDVSDSKEAAPESTHSKAIVLIIDALRHDFIAPQSPSSPTFDDHYHNVVTLPSELTRQHPQHSLIYHTYVDPPTTTLQRIKGLTTGSLPTFVDIGSAFSGSTIQEDTLIHQLKRAHRSTAFVGDDTWMTVFPEVFDEAYPYDSFNVEDLHSVDDGVTHYLFPLMQKGTDFIIGHFLGVDHVGHRVGPSHETMTRKLEQMNEVLRRVVDKLDDDTLLLVMGDHGMDSRGDHGGDSELETSAGLWVYSKGAPLTTNTPSAKKLSESLPHFGSTRSIQQIDILPTLSLLLGLNVPFNNLGGVIPELFSPSSLSLALDVTANQIWRYLRAYANSGSGGEISPFLPLLKTRLDAAKESKAIKAVEDSKYFSKDTTTQDVYQLYSEFFESTLSSCRGIWAQFDKRLMLAGITVLALSLVMLGGLYNKSGRVSNCEWMRSGMKSSTTVLPASFVVAGGVALITLKGQWIECAVFTICLTVELTICRLCPLISTPKLWDAFGIVAHLAVFLSNSYVLWEDRVLLVILQTPIVYALGMAAFAQQARMKKLIAGTAALVALLLRLVAGSTVCREELGGWCAVTFYETASSSLSPWWVYATLLPASISVYFATRYALNISASFAGFANIFIKGITASLVAASLYWIIDLIEIHYPSYIITTLKTTLARTNMLYTALVGLAAWYVSTLCIDVREEQKRENDQVVKQVNILGFSNSYGAYYLLFALVIFAILYITNLPTAQLAMCGALVVLLAFLELSDYQSDEGALRKLLRRPGKYTKKDGKMTAPPPPRPQFWRCAWLAQLAYLLYYSTGHQAVLSTLQWKAAFIGYPKLTYPVAPVLVSLNTLTAFIVVAVFVPLLVYWKVAPRVNGSLHTNTNLLRVCSGFMLYNAAIALATMLAAAWFRRHLMVWKVFAPRFMLAAVALLATDAAIVFAVAVGAAVTTQKVSYVFRTMST